MDVKITDLSALMPKSITILDDPDASTITISAPEETITINSGTLTITTADNLSDIGDVNITSIADNQILAYDSATSKWVNEAQGSAPVTSVNTETGAVVLDTDDISEGSTNLYYTDARVLTKINATDLDALSDVHTATPLDGQVLTWDNGNSYWEPATNPSAPVTSVNSATGVVVLDTGDISESGNLYYTDTRARASNSVTSNSAGDTSSLSYNSSTGVLTFTPADASTKLPLAGGTMTGNIVMSGTETVDGVDISVRDGILTSTTTTANAALPKAGGTMTGNIVMGGTDTVDGVDISVRDGVLTSTTTTANAALPKAGGTMSGEIAMGTEKITGMGDPSAAQDAATKAYADSLIGVVTGYTNGTDNRIITSSGTTTINAESGMTWDGSNAVTSGSAGGITSPILELVTDNSGWNRPQLMCKDSTDDVFSQVGAANDTDKFYQWNITLDPNNTKGRTGVTTWGGDYFVEYKKNYSDQAEISIDNNIYGAHNGFNISVFDDFNDGGGGRYTAKPIKLKGSQVELYADDTGTPFGDFTKIITVDSDSVDITQDVVITDTEQLKFGTTTAIDKDEITTTGAFTINVDSDDSSNEAFIVQSAGTDVLHISRGPGGDAELTVKNSDGFFIKDENDDTVFSMDMSSASSSGINVFRRDENKSLTLTLKTDDDDDTGNFDGAWNFKQNADEKAFILEFDSTEIFEVRDSADVATAAPTDIFEFKIPVVFKSYAVGSLPTTVVAGAQALATGCNSADVSTGTAMAFYDGSLWKYTHLPATTVRT